MRRFSLNLAALALAAAASAPAANASYLDFASSADLGGTVTVGTSGIVGTAIPLQSITGQSTPQGGPTSVSNLMLNFNTGAYQANLTPSVASYGSIGSNVTITGTITTTSGTYSGILFNGGFSDGTQLISTGTNASGVPSFQIVAGGIQGVVNKTLDSSYGLSYSGLSDSGGAFSVTFGTDMTPTSTDITVDPSPLGPPAAAPEPASIALLALGLPVAYLARRRARAARASA